MLRCTIASEDKSNYGEVVFALLDKSHSFLSIPLKPLTQLHTSSLVVHDQVWQQLELGNKKALPFLKD